MDLQETLNTLVHITHDVVPGAECKPVIASAGLPIVFQLARLDARIELRYTESAYPGDGVWVITIQYVIPYTLSDTAENGVLVQKKTRTARVPDATLFPVFVMLLNDIFIYTAM